VANGKDTEFGELLLAWADSAILLAVAEQLDVSPPAETQSTDTDQRGGRSAAKITKFVELGAERNFLRTAGRMDTYRQLSPELRLARVLRALLLEERLTDVLGDLAFDLGRRSEASEAERTFALQHALAKWRVLADKHLWVILEGTFDVANNDDAVTLGLREYDERRPLPEGITVDVPISSNDDYLSGWGKRRLVVGSHIDLCVLGFADQFDPDRNNLTVGSVAVFERVGHGGLLIWRSLGQALREEEATNCH